ncbi:MAG: succinate dehydrogenase cytochrome b subunit [Planctomycetes bacterium]|nr:succinate dehydrogenase cytochrome b subunit [Planctomycetota bacterium]
MSWVCRLYRSSLGAKYVMASTGLLLFGFLIAHLLGNLQMFAGPDAVNSYAEKLRALGPLLWVARIGLLVIAGLHIATALRLAQRNDAARPVAYAKVAQRAVKPATKTMVLSGLVILAYVVYHLAHFTWGVVQADHASLTEKFADGHERHDVYSMVVLGFRTWWVSASYLVALVLLALHLCHGVTSVFQTFGLNHAKYACAIKMTGPAIATLIFLGYASIPVACWLGLIPLVEAR